MNEGHKSGQPKTADPTAHPLRGAWILFFTTFPAGLLLAGLLAHGQVGGGREVAVGLGCMAGFFAGFFVGFHIFWATSRRIPGRVGVMKACLPGVIHMAFWIPVTFTPWGDRPTKGLERLF